MNDTATIAPAFAPFNPADPAGHWKAAVALQEEHEADGMDVTLRALDRIIREVARQVAAGKKPKINPSRLDGAYRALYLLPGLDFAERTFEHVGATLADKSLSGLMHPDALLVQRRAQKQATAATRRTWREALLAYLREHGGERIRRVTETLRTLTGNVLAAAAEAGWSNARAARELRERWGDLRESHARRIVRTELVSAANRGTHLGAVSAAQTYDLDLQKEWLTTTDGRERDTHAAANGQRRDMTEAFVVGGARLMHPGDSSMGAPAEEIIQCRCTQVYVERKR